MYICVPDSKTLQRYFYFVSRLVSNSVKFLLFESVQVYTYIPSRYYSSGGGSACKELVCLSRKATVGLHDNKSKNKNQKCLPPGLCSFLNFHGRTNKRPLD